MSIAWTQAAGVFATLSSAFGVPADRPSPGANVLGPALAPQPSMQRLPSDGRSWRDGNRPQRGSREPRCSRREGGSAGRGRNAVSAEPPHFFAATSRRSGCWRKIADFRLPQSPVESGSGVAISAVKIAAHAQKRTARRRSMVWCYGGKLTSKPDACGDVRGRC